MLAGSLKDEGFTIIATCPGWVETDMGTRSSKEMDVRCFDRLPACIPCDQHVCCKLSLQQTICLGLDTCSARALKLSWSKANYWQ